MPRLTDAERQDILRYLEADEPLPDKYRFLLFDDKREVELVWNGKTGEVTNVVLPFQTIEHVDEPRIETSATSRDRKGAGTSVPPDLQGTLFDSRGRQLSGWTNKLIWGDNKLILSSLKNGPLRDEIEKQGGLKLIYIDPPFDVGADFSMDIEVGDGGDTFTKRPNILEEIAYRDTWGRGADSFIAMIYERLILMRDLLAEDGSIFIHMGADLSSLIRGTADDVFGNSNYRNEIILPGRAVKNLQQQFTSIQRLQVRHDVLLWYSKNAKTRFKPIWMDKHDTGNPDGHWHHFWSTADRPTMRYPLMGVTPASGQWVWKEERALVAWKNYQRYEEEAGGRKLVEYWRDTGSTLEFIRPDPDDGKPQYWREPAEMRIADTIWTGLPVYSAASKYPTEKNEKLISHVLEIASNPGDLVADFFVGSGTTAAVAEKLGRRWIASDLGKFAIHTTRKRMIGVQRALKADGKDYRAFELLNLGRYERQHYVGVTPTVGRESQTSASGDAPVPVGDSAPLRVAADVGDSLREEQKRAIIEQKERDFVDLILRAYKAEQVQHFPAFQGKKAGRMVAVGPVNLPVTRLFVEEIIVECRRKNVTKVDLLGFEFEMGLFPNVLDEARGKGIDIAPKYIPAEVFDKRAVEKGQVVFHDVAAIEVEVIVKGNTVAVKLTDFSVYYSQDSIKGAEDSLAATRSGARGTGSKIVVDRGQIVKVSRDAKGIVKRETLTQTWSDWVDYWAVDFDYQNKKEIIRVPVERESQTSASGSAGESAPLRVAANVGEWEERWTGEYIFENEWQSFRTKKDRTLELVSAFKQVEPGRRKIAVKVVDIFGNDTMTIVEAGVG